jgi:hypothetical protein
MLEGVAVGVLLCALAIAVAVETLIGAVFLRAAVALYNKLAGGADGGGVPELAPGEAMWIIFGTSLAQVIVAALIGLDKGVDGVALLIAFPVSLLVVAEMLSARLPTTVGRAILATMCYLHVVLLVAAVLVGIAVLVFGVALRRA